jgi:hypothetical protein
VGDGRLSSSPRLGEPGINQWSEINKLEELAA